MSYDFAANNDLTRVTYFRCGGALCVFQVEKCLAENMRKLENPDLSADEVRKLRCRHALTLRLTPVMVGGISDHI